MKVAVLWLGQVSCDTGARTYLRELLGPLGEQPGLEVDVHVGDPGFAVPASCRRVPHKVPYRLGAPARPLAEVVLGRTLSCRYDVLLAPFNNVPPTWRGPSVVVQHNVLAFGPRLREHVPLSRVLWRPAALRLSLRRATHVIAVSDYLRRLLLESFPSLDPGRVHVVHHGASLAVETIAAARNGHDPAAPRLLAVAALWPYKRIDQAIGALARIAERRPGATLAVAGPGTPEQCESFEQLARREGVGDRVSFLGNVPPDRLARLYRESDVLLYLSEIESFGLPVLEAMGIGLPVVARKIEGVAEIGGDGPAWVAEDDGVDAVAAAVERVLSDGAYRAERVEEGAAQAAIFTWQHAAEQTAAILRAAVEGS